MPIQKAFPMSWSFTVDAAKLREALDTVRPAVTPASDRGCLVRLGRGIVEARRDDLSIVARLPECSGAARVLLNHARLTAALREAKGPVKLSRGMVAAMVTVDGTGGGWLFNAAHDDAWAVDPEDDPAARSVPVCRLPADQLARCLSGTIDAVGGEDCEGARAQLAGLRIDVLDGVVSFVGWDGRRLYVASADIDQATDDGALTIPVAAARVMLALANRSASTSVQMMRTESAAIWTAGGVTVTAVLLAGKFAPWRKVIPAARPGLQATVGAAALLQAVRQAEVVTSSDSRAVAFQFGHGKVSLSSRSAEYGSAAVACPAAGAQLEAVLRLDPRHVRQWLATLDGAATVSVDPGNGTSPVMLRHEDAVAVVLPMEEVGA